MKQTGQSVEILPMSFFAEPFESLPFLNQYAGKREQEEMGGERYLLQNLQNKQRSISYEIKENFHHGKTLQPKNQYRQLQQQLMAKDQEIQKLKQEVAFLRSQSTLKPKQNSPHRYRQRTSSRHPLQIGDFNNVNYFG